jgi:hemerythrin-like domain-containing protein
MKPTDELMNEHRVIERMLGIVSVACDRMEDGQEVERGLFVGATDFFMNFADRCHHSKEEKLLFERMQTRGVSGEVGPIAVMLREHQDGRAHVKKMTELSGQELSKKTRDELVKASRAYVDLLSKHIQKEDNILYPLANQILTEEDQMELAHGFEEVEAKVMGPGAHEKYNHMIEEYEDRYH